MTFRPTPSPGPIEPPHAPHAPGLATVIASMRVLGDAARRDTFLFRLVRIRVTAGTVSEEHLVRVEREGSTCLTHGAGCREAPLAAESYLSACEARWEEGDDDDHHEASL